jgi:hypothetical protein
MAQHRFPEALEATEQLLAPIQLLAAWRWWVRSSWRWAATPRRAHPQHAAPGAPIPPWPRLARWEEAAPPGGGTRSC